MSYLSSSSMVFVLKLFLLNRPSRLQTTSMGTSSLFHIVIQVSQLVGTVNSNNKYTDMSIIRKQNKFIDIQQRIFRLMGISLLSAFESED